MQRQDLERMTREQLIAHAERLGIPRPRVLTQPEIIDEIIGRTTTGEGERAKARGWLGRARDLLARVVEKGLHLPEAARVLRQEDKSWPAPPPPLPTMTLAEIYAAQGHLDRAITVLDEVIEREPNHREARTLRERFVEQRDRSRARAGRIEVPPSAPPPAVKEAKAHKPPKEASPAADAPATSEPAPTVRAAATAEPATATPEPAAAPSEPTTETTEPTSAAAEAPASDEAIPSTEPAPAAAEPLEEPPLPSRYEVDEVVAIAVDPRTIYLYWEVRPTTLARARAGNPDGEMCVRIASVTASWEGPVIDTRDLHVDALYGDRFVHAIQPGSNVRVSIGWKSAAGFEPLAVGAELTAPRAVPVESVAENVGRWEETPVAPFSTWAPEPRAPAALRSIEERVLEPFVAHRTELLAPRAPRAASARASGEVLATHGAPVDTGVAVWDEPREEIGEREVVVEEAWFVAGGASELGRGAPGRTRKVRVTRLVPAAPGPGGASDLHRGGASDLGR